MRFFLINVNEIINNNREVEFVKNCFERYTGKVS